MWYFNIPLTLMTAINIQYPISRFQCDILILRLPCYDWLDFIPCIDCWSTSGGHIYIRNIHDRNKCRNNKSAAVGKKQWLFLGRNHRLHKLYGRWPLRTFHFSTEDRLCLLSRLFSFFQRRYFFFTSLLFLSFFL